MPESTAKIVNTYRCHRSWAGMAHVAGGRHCQSCDKHLHDFTGLDPEQIIEILEQNGGKMCGRIEAHKVEYSPEPLYLQPVRAVKRSWWKLAAAASALYFALLGKASGQEIPAPATAPSSVSQPAIKLTGTPEVLIADTLAEDSTALLIKGKITDAATGEEMPFANIIVKHKGKKVGGVASDFNGLHELKLKDEKMHGGPDVEVFYVGYHTKVISGVIFNRDKVKRLDISLESDSRFQEIMGIIIYKTPVLQDPGTRTYTREDFRNRFR